ncbi:MAG: HAMP domain-containing sensor histidine kinase, partial [Candidatus Binatia bacterium]
INTMLLISMTEAGVEKPVSQEVDIAALIRNACELFEPIADDKSLTLSWRAKENAVVLGDPRMLQRMLANILDNAVKYTPPGGKVEVSLAESGGRNTISVKDTGVGISAAELPRIFERFYRCDHSRSQPGPGLGLSLARAIARLHGGDITVQSVIGQGSAFTITLPKAA